MMHICHIVSGDLWAGAACQVTNLMSELVKEKEYQFSAVTFNPGRLSAELAGLGIPVLCLPEKRMSSPEILSRIRRHIRDGRIDVIHTHGHKEQVLGCLAAFSSSRPTKVIRTLHGLPEPYKGIAGLRAAISQKVTDLCSVFLTHSIVVVSNDMERRLHRKSWASKMVCIHNGVNPNRLKTVQSPGAVRESLKIAENAFVIGTACRLVPVKRLDILLKAFAIARGEHRKAVLLICGDGPLRDELRRQCEILNLSKPVRFLGHRDDMYDILSALDLFVMTSEHEGIPMVLLEALALGVPVVAPAVGGIPEVVNGHAALLSSPLNELTLAARLSREIQKGASACVQTRKPAGRFSTAAQTAKETRDVYEKCNIRP